MEKEKIAVIFGGMSTENEVSVISGTSILKNINKEKYDIYPIYIDKKGVWYQYLEDYTQEIELGKNIENKKEIKNIVEYLKPIDIVFPVLHGLYGEDGTIQGLFELLNKKYVGCRVLASSVGMDKVYTKIIFEKANIKQAKYEYIRKYKNEYIYIYPNFEEEKMNLEKVAEKIENNITYPMYVKPSNSGSSVGIRKVNNNKELKSAIEFASQYDNKILIEEQVKGREIECAVLGNEEVKASCVGEIKAADEFYSYDAKYKNNESKTIIPADISKSKKQEIQKLAIKAFKAIDGKGLSRVDFFIKEGTEEVYINEINTLPGFTNISMYPKLFEKIGVPYKELIENLINLAKI